MKRILTLIMALGLLLTACGTEGPVSPTGRADFDAFVSDLNAQKKSIPPWTQEETEPYRLPTIAPGLVSDAELDALLAEPEAPPEEITADQAKADADLFFRVLRASYGAYDYFGGDEVFLPLREKIMHTLDNSPTHTPKQLYRYFNRALSPVIQDEHFSINGYPFAIPEPMYYVADLYLSPADVDTETAQLLRPTVDPDGALSWCFATTHQSQKGLPTQVVVGGKSVTLRWQRAANLSFSARPAYEESNRGGLPHLVSRTLTADEKTERDLDRLAAAGAVWREKPLFLVDLRGNWGGNGIYFHRWYSDYVGVEPVEKACWSTRYSKLFSRTYANFPGAEDSLRAAREAEGTSRTEVTDLVVQPNKNLIFLLQDGGTSSAGEDAVIALRTLENVVTVGSNTAGCLMMGNKLQGWLPYSGISFSLGANLTLRGVTENLEGRGILPDLWVPPQDAEDAVARLVHYYGLK